MGNRSFIVLVALGMLVAAVVVEAPVRELDPAATMHRMARDRVAEMKSSIWSTWAATPAAALDFPRVRNPGKHWIGPVRTPWVQVAVQATPATAEGAAE